MVVKGFHKKAKWCAVLQNYDWLHGNLQEQGGFPFQAKKKNCSTCANVLPLNSAVLNTSNTLLCNTYLLQAATLPHICCYESSRDNPTIATTYIQHAVQVPATCAKSKLQKWP